MSKRTAEDFFWGGAEAQNEQLLIYFAVPELMSPAKWKGQYRSLR